MIKHEQTESTQINFNKLESRLLNINNEIAETCWQYERKFFRQLRNEVENKIYKPILIMATGGSKISAYYLQMYFNTLGIITEVIEPRDYFYKQNINSYKKLIVISNSGKTKGINEALKNFKGEKYLFTGTYEDVNTYNLISWSNGYYEDKEKSFISIVPTLAPILMTLDCIEIYDKEISNLKEINTKLHTLLEKSKQRIKNMNFNFKNSNILQIITGLDTKVSSKSLESNLTESGTIPVITHDKGSYCHGRSNLLFNNPTSIVIYLSHSLKELDKVLLETLTNEYPNIFLFHTLDLKDNIYWKELYLTLQMYYLSKKIAEEKNIDLTMPEYNPNVIKKLYKFKGEM